MRRLAGHSGNVHTFCLMGTLALAACATTKGGTARDSRDVVRMEPVLIRNQVDPLTGLDGYDASQLLGVGNELYRKADYDKAIKVYDHLVEVFPGSEHVPSAHFNAGLAYEQLAEYEVALGRFRTVVENPKSERSRKDALFRIAFALAKLDRWRDGADAFWRILQIVDLTVMDQLEARVGLAVAMFMQDDYATAEREFMRALGYFAENEKLEFLPADYWVGQSRFYLGEIYARQFEQFELSEPDVAEDEWADMMGAELEEKCRLLLRSQSNFIRAIRVGHPGWATAAGYRIGSLYEGLYDDLMKLPVPPSLDGEAAQYYTEMLRERVSVLVVKAIKVYEQSLQMAARVGEQNEWVAKTSASLERMKALYLTTLEG